MPKNDREREYAKMLFVYEGKEVKELTETLGVPESTLYYWCREDNWVHIRQNYQTNPRSLANELERSILKIIEICKGEDGKGYVDGKAADSIAKLNRVRKDILKETNYMGIAFDVIQELQFFLRDKAPKVLTTRLAALMQDFLKYLLEKTS